MLAGVISAGVITITGCEKKQKDYNKNEKVSEQTAGYYFDGLEDVFIVIEKDNKQILHKGDIDALPIRGGGNSCVKYSFDCGQEFISNNNYFVYDNQPNEQQYDEICEDCIKNN